MSEKRLPENLQRASVYRLLSACLYQPEKCFIEEDVFGQLAAALKAIGSDLAGLAAKMDQAFRSVDEEELLQDYSRLFLGPFEIPAKPYGSVYLDGESVVMGDSTIAVKACYAEVDFAIAEDFSELPDHITVELEFLYLLCFKQNEALSEKDTVALERFIGLEQKFLQDHLGRWVSELGRRIRENAETDFYRLLAELTEQYVLAQKG